MNLFSSLEKILMVRQLRKNFIAFFQSLLHRKLTSFMVFVNESGLFCHLEGYLSSSLSFICFTGALAHFDGLFLFLCFNWLCFLLLLLRRGIDSGFLVLRVAAFELEESFDHLRAIAVAHFLIFIIVRLYSFQLIIAKWRVVCFTSST